MHTRIFLVETMYHSRSSTHVDRRVDEVEKEGDPGTSSARNWRHDNNNPELTTGLCQIYMNNEGFANSLSVISSSAITEATAAPFTTWRKRRRRCSSTSRRRPKETAKKRARTCIFIDESYGDPTAPRLYESDADEGNRSPFFPDLFPLVPSPFFHKHKKKNLSDQP